MAKASLKRDVGLEILEGLRELGEATLAWVAW